MPLNKQETIRLGVAVLLLVFSVGIVASLIFRFGINPMAHQNSVTIGQLLFGEQPDTQIPTRQQIETSQAGQVAGEADQRRFDVEQIDTAEFANSPVAVRFVRTVEFPMLRWGTSVVIPQEVYDPVPAEVLDIDSYPWKPLIAVPVTSGVENPIYSFYSSPDQNNFIIVLTPEVDVYDVYVYREFAPGSSFTRITRFIDSRSGQAVIPKGSALSQDGRYLTLALFECYSCGNEVPLTMIVDSETGRYDTVGQTSSFTWLSGGRYQYKEYIETDCPDNPQAKCVVDPQFLDPQTGSL